MAYKEVDMQVIQNYIDNHMAPAGCEFIDMQVMKILQNMNLCIHHIYQSQSHLVQYHITNTPLQKQVRCL
jgi:hypothetical protein